MVDLQRKIAAENNVVMDGRDIGTVVLPDAGVKIFLTASTEVRAKRRYLQMLEAGQDADLEEIRKDMEERDYRDSHRENSPLKQAEDAVYLDTSDMTMAEVIAFIRKLAEEKA
jgi:cytidylate kinase